MLRFDGTEETTMRDVAGADEAGSRTDARTLLRTDPLRIGISTRALADLEEEHRVFEDGGVQAYAEMQLDCEDRIIGKVAGFEVVARLLALNEAAGPPFVEAVLLSRNSPDFSLRAFKSIEHYGLDIKTGSSTSGGSLAPFVREWDVDLFFSNDDVDVAGVVSDGAAAARLSCVPKGGEVGNGQEVRIAFDGDAVIFGSKSDEVYERNGLGAFLEHETARARDPVALNPFGNFLRKLSLLRRIHLNAGDVGRVRIALVTARAAPAHERAVRTLRAWGTPADEAHFVGSRRKAPILKAFGVHIFFDDQERHVLGASEEVPAGHVPSPRRPRHPFTPSA